MKKIQNNKKGILSKFFVKICRLFGYEIIDQSDFSVPTLGKDLNDNLSIPGKKSITVPLGEIKITRNIKSFHVIVKTCTSVNLVTQNKSRIFEKDKSEYTFRSFPTRINKIKSAASGIDSVFFPEHPLVYSKTSDLGKTLFSINGNNTTLGDFVEFANSVMIRNLDRESDMIINELLDRLIEEKLLK